MTEIKKDEQESQLYLGPLLVKPYGSPSMWKQLEPVWVGQWPLRQENLEAL